MDSDKMRNENIAVTQKILFLSYRHELYEKFCFCLAGQHDILYHRIREHKSGRILQAIQSGADGYLVNTQSAEEIIAEAKALIRLQTRIKNNPEIWHYEGLEIIPDKRQVFLGGKEILLTRIEFDIVYYLAAQNGRAIPYQELYEAVLHNEYLPDHRGIMAHIHRIRGKLETDAKIRITFAMSMG